MSNSKITKIDVLLANLSLARPREAARLAAHYVAGVLDCDSLTDGIKAVSEGMNQARRPGPRVETLA